MDKKQLLDTLQMLRSESVALQNSATNYNVQTLMHKYDMLFIGEKFNHIYSHELCHMLNTKLGIKVSLDELNTIIPEVCATLDMKSEPMIKLEDARKPNPPIGCYQIVLF